MKISTSEEDISKSKKFQIKLKRNLLEKNKNQKNFMLKKDNFSKKEYQKSCKCETEYN